MRKRIDCKYCGAFLGEIIDDGQIFRSRGIMLYHRTVIFCFCNRSFTFIPDDPQESPQTPEQFAATKQIRHSLAVGRPKHERGIIHDE